MDKETAIQTAIEALDYQASEIYEGGEYDDPSVQAFVKTQKDAITVLKELL